jgi:excinuclease ABC subunit B
VQTETTENVAPTVAAEAEYSSYDIPKLEKEIASEQNLMKKAAKELNFIEAAQHRDRMRLLEAQLNAIKSNE